MPLPRTNPKYLKSYCYIKTENRSNKGFRKDVYFPVGTGNIVVHYLGDESLSVMMPHGNSNKKEPYFRTKPSVKEEIQKKIEVEKPHIVYKNLVCENMEGHDAVSKPRNVRQLHNAKATKQEAIRLTRDAIYNTHELAYEGGFIHDFFVPLFRFLNHCSVFSITEQKKRNSVFLYHCSVFCTSVPLFPQQNKNGTVCFCSTVPFFAPLFRFPQRNKKRNSAFLYHCSVFALLFRFFGPLFRLFYNGTKKRSSVFLYHCSVFALLFRFFHNRTKTEQCVSVPLFRFLHFCSVFSTTEQNGTVCFCTTVPFFCTTVPFFPQRNKTEQCVFVPLFRFFALLFRFSTTEQNQNGVFLYHCSVFCTSVPFFPQQTKKRNIVFLNHCSVFFHKGTKNGTVCFCTTCFCTTVPFFALLFHFFHNRTKNGTVCFCTTVPFFALLFRFFHNRTKRNSVCLYHCSFFLHHCSVFSTTEQKTEQCVFVPLFRLLHNGTKKNSTVKDWLAE